MPDAVSAARHAIAPRTVRQRVVTPTAGHASGDRGRPSAPFRTSYLLGARIRHERERERLPRARGNRPEPVRRRRPQPDARPEDPVDVRPDVGHRPPRPSLAVAALNGDELLIARRVTA